MSCADITHVVNCLSDAAAEDCWPVLRGTAALLPPTVHSSQGKIGTKASAASKDHLPLRTEEPCYSSSLYRAPSHCRMNSADTI